MLGFFGLGSFWDWDPAKSCLIKAVDSLDRPIEAAFPAGLVLLARFSLPFSTCSFNASTKRGVVIQLSGELGMKGEAFCVCSIDMS